MATKKKSANKSAPSQEIDKDTAKALAKIAIRPSANAAAVISEYGKMFGDHDISDLMDELVDSIETVNDGDLKRCEGMLMGQAQALQSIFTNLARRAVNQEYLKNYEAFMRLALKAQSQCRQTLETLSNIKNPPVVYAKQANISNGPQQINNGMPAPAPHAEEIKNQPNELLEVIDGERLDTGTAQETIGSDTALAAVG
ncbi:MAG: hypothetical protein LUQ11_14310 [Methylococcaceae bacterium]|nr:hypothetical protein [Methylococcaceae bacterium]